MSIFEHANLSAGAYHNDPASRPDHHHIGSITVASNPMRAVLAVSPTAFVVIWWVMQLFHILCIVHAYAVIAIHRYCIITGMATTIAYLGASTWSFFEPVIVAYAMLIVLHAVAFTATLWWSIRHREWRLTNKPHAAKVQQNRSAISQSVVVGIRRISRSAIVPGDISTYSRRTRVGKGLSTVSQIVQRFGSATFKQLRKLNLDGQYYEIRFLLSELVEIVLQVFQAYKLSGLVPRVWINRLYAIVLVLNCWSTPLVYMGLHRDRLFQRILLRAMDALFDVITSMVIPFVVFYPYYVDFDFVRQDFPLDYYYSDVWFIQAISENRQVFVTSWVDYISKVSPGLSIFASTFVLKRYIVMGKPTSQEEMKPTESRRNAGVASSISKFLSTIVPKTMLVVSTSMHSRRNTIRNLILDGSQEMRKPSKMSLNEGQKAMLASLFSKYKCSWHDVCFIVCGLAILVIHIHATVIGEFSSVRGCLLEVRPWFQTAYSCVVLEVNCAHSHYANGSDVDAIQTAMQHTKIDGIRSFVVASCASLHMPTVVHRMSSLQMLKVYNSTIERWGPEAELHQDFHHDLQMLYICDTNFTAGKLPIGILGDNFPKRLVDIEFSGTNLHTLPSDLHERWTFVQYFVLERSPGINEISDTLVKLKIPQLMLGWNSIERVPDDLFADQSFWVLRLDGNPLSALPQRIGSIELLYKVGISHSLVSSLPQWMNTTQYDPSTGAVIEPDWSPVAVLAGATLLCSDDRETLRTTAMSYFEWDCSTDTIPFAYPVDQERRWRASSRAARLGSYD